MSYYIDIIWREILSNQYFRIVHLGKRKGAGRYFVLVSHLPSVTALLGCGEPTPWPVDVPRGPFPSDPGGRRSLNLYGSGQHWLNKGLDLTPMEAETVGACGSDWGKDR